MYDFAKHADGVSPMHPPWLILENLPYELSEVPGNDPVALTMDLLSGVQAVHLAGFIHRDLNPNNVRATKNALSDGSDKWILKICDAGSATLQSTVDKGFAGTLNYIAPEIWTNRQRYDELVDVFSLGVIVLMLFTPYTAEQHAEERLSGYDDVVWWVIDAAVPLVQAAPEPYQPLLYGMLALEPKDRWDTQTCISYLSCLSGSSRATCNADNKGNTAKSRRKRTHELLLRDDHKFDDARMVRPKLEHSGEVSTPAHSTASYDGTFYTAPVIQSGGLEGSGPSNISVAAEEPESLCDTFSWATVGACEERPPSKSLPDPAPSLPDSCEGRKPDWVDNTPLADWKRRLEDGSLMLPSDYRPDDDKEDDSRYPTSVPVTPHLDESEVLGKPRASEPRGQDSETVLCADEDRDICVEMGGEIFTYVVPSWTDRVLARFASIGGGLFGAYKDKADLISDAKDADAEDNCDESSYDDSDDGTRTEVPD